MSLFDVTLNNVSLSSLSDKIIVRDILEEPIDQEIYKTPIAMNAGQRVSNVVRRALSVRVVYVIRERDPRKRATIQSDIAAWARDGGVLTVNYRTFTDFSEGTSVQLHVVLEIPPVQDSALKWTQDLSMTFTAYSPPYWESTTQLGAAVNTSYNSQMGVYIGGVTFYASGTAPRSPITATINNISGGILQSLNISANHCSFRLVGLNISPGGTLYIEYDENGLLKIRDNINYSLLANRTADSSDDLYFVPGSANSFTITSNVQVSGYLWCRGLYV